MKEKKHTNLSKILAVLKNKGEFVFNVNDSITKLETNCYIVKSCVIPVDENNTAVYTLIELKYFIKQHSTLFQDIFDSAAYNKSFEATAPAPAGINKLSENYYNERLEHYEIKEPLDPPAAPAPAAPKKAKSLLDILRQETTINCLAIQKKLRALEYSLL